MQETSNLTLSDEKALFTKSQRNFRKKTGLICYSCRQKGHKSVHCPDNSKKTTESSDSRSSGDNRKALFAFSAVFLNGKFDAYDWYIDSGATKHMTMHSNWITGSRRYGLTGIRAANNNLMEVECSGAVNFNVDVKGKCSQVQIRDVLCVPKLTTNLLSVSEITDKGNFVNFSSKGCTVRDNDGQLLATASLVDGLNKLDGKKGCGIGNDSISLFNGIMASKTWSFEPI